MGVLHGRSFQDELGHINDLRDGIVNICNALYIDASLLFCSCWSLGGGKNTESWLYYYIMFALTRIDKIALRRGRSRDWLSVGG